MAEIASGYLRQPARTIELYQHYLGNIASDVGGQGSPARDAFVDYERGRKCAGWARGVHGQHRYSALPLVAEGVCAALRRSRVRWRVDAIIPPHAQRDACSRQTV